MNKAFICGRLVADPEIRYTADGHPIARARIAVNRQTRQDEENAADFLNIVCFGRLAEFYEKYVKKGTKMLVIGRIRTGSYTDKDGRTVYTTDIIVDESEFAESKTAAASGTTTSGTGTLPFKPDGDGFIQFPDGVYDNGLPFN